MYVLIFVVQSLLALKITNPQASILLLPESKRALAPFALQPESESEHVASYKLKIHCSESASDILLFGDAVGDICAKYEVSDTVNGINALLEKVEVTLAQDAKATDSASVLYTIVNEQDETKTIAFQQALKVATEVPVLVVNEAIYFQPGSASAFNVKILSVEDEYLQAEPQPLFSIVITAGLLPDWLQYQFEKGELYFTGSTPADLGSNLSFSFAVQDKTTGLISHDMEISLAASLNGQVSSNKALVIVLFLIFTGIIACILLLIFMFSRKNAPNGVQLKQSMAAHVAQQQENVDSSGNVLSDSILNWNKKLIEKHKERNFSTTDVDEEANAPDRSPGFAYECFDETFALTEEDRPNDIKMSDRLSDIRHDDGNKSSFLDDLRF